jgi:deoxyribonuclease IV
MTQRRPAQGVNSARGAPARKAGRGVAARPEQDELGAHVSSAGGVRNAPARAAELDSVVLQLFTKMPSRWAEPTCGDDEARAFDEQQREHGVRAVAAHDSYLINLASPDPVLRARSTDSFRAEVRRCGMLGIPAVVSHPGNATDGDMESGLARNAEAIQQVLEETADVAVLLETTAGTGRVLGSTFDELARLLNRLPAGLQPRLGVCLDTCHVWAAGYDLRRHWHDVLARFDDTIGLHRIRIFHLNDSVGGCGSRRDRHAHIGLGALGDEPFRNLLLDDRFRAVPKLLETPKDDDALAADRANLARLRSFRVDGPDRTKSAKSRKK